VPGTRKEKILRSTKLADIKKEVEGAIADLRASRKVLVIDQLDALLAVTDDSTTSLTLQDAVLGLRSVRFPQLRKSTSLTKSFAACSQYATHSVSRRASCCCPSYDA
jgi:hypothetical protein